MKENITSAKKKIIYWQIGLWLLDKLIMVGIVVLFSR